jgi:hypothetical protein
MPDPPETLHQSATPSEILERLEVVRERYRMGVMDLGSFNQTLRLFQFQDAGGRLWAPGAQSGRWYQWNGREWAPGAPPERLQLPELPLELTPASERPDLPAAPAVQGPRAVACPNCGSTNVGKKFCTTCGTKLG